MRAVKEWVGKDDDTKIPDRVRQRVVARANQCCQACGMRIRHSGEVDHVISLKNWNPTPEAPHGNRESNLRLLCQSCHAAKSHRDVLEKSAVYQKQRKLGPLRREQSPWSKRYHAMKEWKAKREAERGND